MLCPNCKKQIPDDSHDCPYCGTNIDHKSQVVQEISHRRYQRWIFYALIVFIFLGMIGIIVRIYNANSALVADMATMEKRMEESLVAQEKVAEEAEAAKEELTAKESEIQSIESELASIKSDLGKKERELAEKTKDLKDKLQNKTKVEEKYQSCQLDLDKADSNIYSLVVNLGRGASTEDLNQIPLADANLGGEDADGDGLSDVVESALGTDPQKEDTDGDGYDDKSELLSNYNPKGDGVFEVNEEFIAKYKGDILLQVEGNGEAWYVGGNGKKYFLGTPSSAFEVMRSVEYWTQDPESEEEGEEQVGEEDQTGESGEEVVENDEDAQDTAPAEEEKGTSSGMLGM